jgi:ribosomal protein S18 acetylase RimI-like enzyme
LVIDKYRSQKIGSSLWQKAFNDNLPADAVVCFHSVPRAVTYYEKMGYKKTLLTNYYHKLQANHLMNLPNEL